MRARLSKWIDLLRTGFWFVPSLMLVMAGALALVLLFIDRRFDPGMKGSLAWAYTGGPEGARSLLSTIAGSMITAASVTFSLAAVALSIASQQYGSRVLRNFMRDRITQVLMGTFVSTFLYSVMVIRVIRGSEFSGGFVPAIAITVAIALSLISLLMLVYFVHHVSSSIQASHIVSTISQDMQDAIPRLFPSDVSTAPANSAPFRWQELEQAAPICVCSNGYLESIDTEELMRIARQQDTFLEITIKPGDHVVEGAELVRVWGRALDGDVRSKVAKAFDIGQKRTPLQDIRYQFQQLTDVVVRALSPGINDPFTAVNGIDELATGLALLARRPRVRELRQDERGVARLFVPDPQIGDIVRETVGHIGLYAAGDPFVMERLRRVLYILGPDLKGPKEAAALHSLEKELDRRQKAKGEA